MTAKVMFDAKHKQYKEKPEGAAVGAVKKSVTSVIDASIKDIADRLVNGEVCCPAVLHGGIGADNFESQQLFLIDIDNGGKKNGEFIALPSKEIIEIDDALHLCAQNGLKPCFAYNTYNNCVHYGFEGDFVYDVPKFRVAFVFDEPITDKAVRDKLSIYLMGLFNDPDQSTKNADRLFFGTNEGACCYEDYDAVNELSEVLLRITTAAGAGTSPGSEGSSGADQDDEKLKQQNFFRDKYKTSDDEWAELLTDALNHIPCGDTQYNEWISIEAALKNEGLDFSVWDQWSATDPARYDPEQCEKLWERSVKTGLNGGYIIALAKQHGFKLPKIKEKKESSDMEENTHFEVNLVSGRELQKMNLPPIKYTVERMIPEGYTIMSAPFKYGKSWYALELCLAVAEGADFLGMKTTRGAAVYIALEDCDKYAQERLNLVLNGRESPEGFYYIYDYKNVPTLDNGFIGYLDVMADNIREMGQELRLVVVDVLAKVQYHSKKNELGYNSDYRTGSALKQWADEHQVSIMAITHTTKAKNEDIFMNTTGSNGVTASADAIITIDKEKRTSKEGLLAITGRRVRESYHQVTLNGFIWENLGECDPESMKVDKEKREQEARRTAYLESNIRKAIKALADRYSGERFRARQIIDRARDIGIILTEDAKEVGGFICKNQNLIIKEDNVKTDIINNGQASHLYRFSVWEPCNDFIEFVDNHE